MNVESTKIQQQTNTQKTSSTKPEVKEGDVKFSDELKNLSADNKNDKNIKQTPKTTNEKTDIKKNNEKFYSGKKIKNETKDDKIKKTDSKNIQIKTIQKDNPEKTAVEALNGLNDMVKNMNKINKPQKVFNTEKKPKAEIKKENVNHTNEKLSANIKNGPAFDDKIKKSHKEIKTIKEDIDLIDNNMNIHEKKDLLTPDMNANMNFNNNNGQQFSEFVNTQKTLGELKVTAKEVEEEKNILSTMEENIAIANKNMAMKDQPKTKTVTTEEGIKKVDIKTDITVDTIVSFDTVTMDKSDVEFFTNLVDGNIQNLSEVQNPQKSAHVSKTLADLLAKSMEDNKPIRINFDNDISVIIRIDREGKISADFLPSSQIAEAYLKENLPLLRQRFDDNNIDYNELNQRKQKQGDSNNENRKKDRKDE